MLFSAPFDKNSPRSFRTSAVAPLPEGNVLEIGYNCTPAGLRQVMQRQVYILHYITAGRGNFCGQPFAAGDGYLVCPGERETVTADETDPYEAYWIMVQGGWFAAFCRQCGLPQHNGVFHGAPSAACAALLHRALWGAEPENEWEEAAMMNAALQQLMALHYHAAQPVTRAGEEGAGQKLKQLLCAHYDKPLRMEEIAARLHYSRNYLYTLFKGEYGVSPKEYLSNLRIERAKELLRLPGGPSVSEVALAVGYKDPLYFSRVFHQKTGLSPLAFLQRERG